MLATQYHRFQEVNQDEYYACSSGWFWICLQGCYKMGFEWTHQNKNMSSLLNETSQTCSFIALPKTDVGSVENVEIPAHKFSQH
jgi:hypothetical protein